MILLIEAAGGSVEGRTTLQKWLYFTSVKAKLDFGFAPHFYGPYSETVSSAISNLIASDFIFEMGRMTRYERIIYTYTLTEDGKNIARDLKGTNKELYSKIKEVVDTCTEVVGNNINTLSSAAKVYYLLQKQGKQITYEEIKRMGKNLGWQLSETEIDSAAKLLSALKLARKED